MEKHRVVSTFNSLEALLNSPSEFLTLNEAAAVCRVHLMSVRRWIDAGQLEVAYFGGSVRIYKDSFVKFVNAASVNCSWVLTETGYKKVSLRETGNKGELNIE